MEKKIPTLYACGMSQRVISEQVRNSCDVNISPELVSKISEKIMPEVTVWQNGTLETVFPKSQALRYIVHRIRSSVRFVSCKDIREDGAQVIVLGCTAMVDVTETVQARLHAAGYGVPVLEAAQSAVMLLELSVKMGLQQSRITYMPVPEKSI